MKNLIQFLQKNVHWLLFILFFALSVFALVKSNEFQRSRYLAVFQEVAGRVYGVSNGVRSYLDLKRANDDLTLEVARLYGQLRSYEKRLEDLEGENLFLDTLYYDREPFPNRLQYTLIPARVINNQVSGTANFLTVDKGSRDGIESDMGVFSARGIVGVVTNVSPHFSRIIPLINPKFRPSCKIKKTNHFGPLVWDGKEPGYAYLEELPSHAVYQIGDTIVTSGYSTIFPEGIPVGVVEGSQNNRSGDYNSLRVKLFTDFTTLGNVLIVSNNLKAEQLNLEN